MQTEPQYKELSEKLCALDSKVSEIHSLLDGNFKRLFAKVGSGQKRKHKNNTLYDRIVSATMLLAQKKNRAVSNTEIIDFLNLNGIVLGDTKKYQNSFLGSNLSYEIRRPDARIVRTARGFYDVRDSKKGEKEKDENENLKA